ncbi:hypothetical protein NDU88_000867 [Pleurodeles waltl]|uniref:Uncharacterized protein n=1 Tax=Pleurodeles waltl TaxID=8319 RepID=A0AAV7Q2M3_PLEWA|nr:hypothetical protein NDU88_000867 [Pleurodeles waltl]
MADESNAPLRAPPAVGDFLLCLQSSLDDPVTFLAICGSSASDACSVPLPLAVGMGHLGPRACVGCCCPGPASSVASTDLLAAPLGVTTEAGGCSFRAAQGGWELVCPVLMSLWDADQTLLGIWIGHCRQTPVPHAGGGTALLKETSD